ncbi:MAG: alternative ribosome rescue aminoacyl-tRNA hydrolase ArfB [Desulfobacteraceae bacterium]|jgi:ribosome-associated protein
MIQITPLLSIRESCLQMTFTGASGPGGQNVNKVATAVQLRLDLQACQDLPPAVRERLAVLGGSRVSRDGVLVIDARRFRTQEQNRADAVARLVALIRRATVTPKARRPTRPSAAARRKRLASKRRRALLKDTRRPVGRNHT